MLGSSSGASALVPLDDPPLTRAELALVRRRKATEEKLAKVLARSQALDERESLRRLQLDVQTVAARRVNDISAAAHREWFHSPLTRNSSAMPGPGSYSVESDTIGFESSRSKSAIEPLGVMAGRPSILQGLSSSPGPAAYVGDSLVSARFKHVGAVKFNGRPTSFAIDPLHDGPGPAAYLPQRVDLAAVHCPAFGLSNVPAREEIKASAAPAPTTYSPKPVVPEGGGKFAVERSEYLRRDIVQQKQLAKSRVRALQPGPGHYSVALGTLSQSKACRFSTQPRVSEPMEAEVRPGPGAYFPTISVSREQELARLRKTLLKRELRHLSA